MTVWVGCRGLGRAHLATPEKYRTNNFKKILGNLKTDVVQKVRILRLPLRCARENMNSICIKMQITIYFPWSSRVLRAVGRVHVRPFLLRNVSHGSHFVIPPECSENHYYLSQSLVLVPLPAFSWRSLFSATSTLRLTCRSLKCIYGTYYAVSLL